MLMLFFCLKDTLNIAPNGKKADAPYTTFASFDIGAAYKTHGYFNYTYGNCRGHTLLVEATALLIWITVSSGRCWFWRRFGI